MTDPTRNGPVLLCFDGSPDAAAAIEIAAALLAPRPATVLSAWEPLRTWAPYDPASILEAPIGKLAAKALELDAIAEEVAQREAERGAELAAAAGLEAQALVGHGKAWRVICDTADELDAAVIVIGRRGLSRVQSALLGSVSSAVSLHARQPVLVGRATGHGSHTHER